MKELYKCDTGGQFEIIVSQRNKYQIYLDVQDLDLDLETGVYLSKDQAKNLAAQLLKFANSEPAAWLNVGYSATGVVAVSTDGKTVLHGADGVEWGKPTNGDSEK